MNMGWKLTLAAAAVAVVVAAQRDSSRLTQEQV